MSIGASLDMYRKVPADLLNGTKRGSLLSIIALLAMAVLFTLETRAFLRSMSFTNVALDKSPDKKIRVNFNITMMDMRCDYAVVDVISNYGAEQNVTQHISKFQVDQDGVNKRYYHRNLRQNDLILWDETVTETLEELIEHGADAVSLDETSFNEFIQHYKFVFVDFYAGWCSHCRDMAPTWEKLAKVMDAAAAGMVDERLRNEGKKVGKEPGDWSEEEYEHAVLLKLPVKIAKVDCVDHPQFCREQGIQAYPTMRLFVNGKKFGTDYQGHRTVVDFTDYLAAVETQFEQEGGAVAFSDTIAQQLHESEGGVLPRDRLLRALKTEWLAEAHPGCQLSGFLLVDRVPGKFHFQARSVGMEFSPAMANVSHEVHHLSFGEPYINRKIEASSSPIAAKLAPMNENVYVTYNAHEAHHHYIKVVPTRLLDHDRGVTVYQVLEQSQLTYVAPDHSPEAQFQYDFSPIAVSYGSKSRKWYDYLTSLMAIIGGTFTVVGMIESSLEVVAARKKIIFR